MTKRTAILVGLTIAILMDTAGQLTWKLASIHLPNTQSVRTLILEAGHQPYFLLVGGIFLLQLFNWLAVLKNAELSYAQPITSLSYVTVCMASALFFHEHVGFTKMFGIGLILVGVWQLHENPTTTEPTS